MSCHPTGPLPSPLPRPLPGPLPGLLPGPLPGPLDTPLLAGLPADVTADLLQHATHDHYRRGETLFADGDPGDAVLLVLSGKVKVIRPGSDGQDLLLTMVGPGDLLGELCLFDRSPRRATAVAVQPTHATRFPADLTRAWLRRHPPSAMRMMELLAARIRRMTDSFEDVSGVDVATRVARVLMDHATRFGRPTPVGLRFTLDLSQEELAHQVRASRERVNQILVDFTRRGWIARDDHDLLIREPTRLTSRARRRTR